MIVRRALPAPAASTASAAPAASAVERALAIAILLMIGGMSHFGVHFGSQGDADSGGSVAAQCAWFAVYSMAIAAIALDRERAASLLVRGWPILALVGFVVLSAMWSDRPDLSLRRGIGLLGTTAIGFAIVSRFALADFLRTFAIASGIAALASLVAVVALPTGRVYLDPLYVGAWQGIYDGKNYLGQAMALGLVTILAASGARAAWPRWILPGLFGLCAVLLLGSHSQSALVSAILVAGLVCTVRLWRSKPAWRVAMLVAVVLAAAGVWFATLLDPDVADVFGLLGRDDSLTGRTDVWAYVQSAIADRPLFGYGYSTFWFGPVQSYLPPDAGWLPFHAHDGFLELELDSGLAGLTIFIGAFAVGCRRAIRSYLAAGTGESLWPLSIMAFFLLANVTECSIAKYNNLSWVVFVAAFLFAGRASSELGSPARASDSRRSP